MLRYATILHFIDNERIEVVPIIFTQYASPVCVTPNCTSRYVRGARHVYSDVHSLWHFYNIPQ